MIKLIVVGKLKEKYLIDCVNDYTKRISKYDKIEIIELKDDDISNESSRIMNCIKQGEYVITLEILGDMLTSPELSKRIEKIKVDGFSTITFIIGGSNGLSDEVKNKSNFSLSFSKMTFPHGLFRIILLEQIYRSFKISNNESYHK